MSSDVLMDLFNNKLATTTKPDAPIKKPKKIKKKDIIKEDIYTRELQYYEYETIKDIKVFTGVLFENKANILENIELFKTMSPINLFTELFPCTLTCTGEFSNILFNESELIPTLEIPPINFIDILEIGCNYGEVFVFPHPLIAHDIASMIRCIYITSVKIGCSCNAPMDIEQIKTAVDAVNNMSERITELFDINIRDKAETKIVKKFKAMQNYQVLSYEETKEIYNIIESHIPLNSDIRFCNAYINNINAVLEIFHTYEKSCTCCNKYILDKGLTNVNKKSITKRVKSATRGRKPKEKKKRKVQGSGAYFSSQITFYVYNHQNEKITKFKVFRNGRFQIPGGLHPDMSDLIDSIITLKQYFNYILYSDAIPTVGISVVPTVGISYVISVMRNYTSRIVNTEDNTKTIILSKLEDIFSHEKSMPHNTHKSKYVAFFNKLKMSDATKHTIFNYCNTSFYTISEISLNSERYPGLLVKFLRPIPNNDTKRITVKILSSGKINFDGCNSEIEVFEIYYWLQYLFNKYWSEIIYDSAEKIDEVVSSDSEDGYTSIYDN
jgi:hypothetical protein